MFNRLFIVLELRAFSMLPDLFRRADVAVGEAGEELRFVRGLFDACLFKQEDLLRALRHSYVKFLCLRHIHEVKILKFSESDLLLKYR